jgi:hypothetical protein
VTTDATVAARIHEHLLEGLAEPLCAMVATDPAQGPTARDVAARLCALGLGT